MNITLRGACDLHIHSAPDFGERIGDDIQIAEVCRNAGMRAIGIKCHFDTTMSRALYTRRAVEGIDVYGGIVLNCQAGGINPAAVDAALRFGAKLIWMPTLHAQHQHQYVMTESAGSFSSQGETDVELLTVLDKDGNLKAECYKILKLAKQYDAILGTGHISPREGILLAEAARDVGFEKLVVTHPFFSPPAYTLEQLKEIYELGAFIEFSTNCLNPLPRPINVRLYPETVEMLGSERIIIGSDCGHPRKTFPHEAIRAFAYTLSMLGVAERDLSAMMIENYDKLL